MGEDIPWDDGAPDPRRVLEAGLETLFPHLTGEEIMDLRRQVEELGHYTKRGLEIVRHSQDPKGVRGEMQSLIKASQTIRAILANHSKCDDRFADLFGRELDQSSDFGARGPKALAELNVHLTILEKIAESVSDTEGVLQYVAARDYKENGPGHSPITAVLWPGLFHLWDKHCGKQSRTVTVGLESFVSVTHARFGLGEPNRETLKKAVETYRKGGFPNTLLRNGIFRSIR